MSWFSGWSWSCLFLVKRTQIVKDFPVNTGPRNDKHGILSPFSDIPFKHEYDQYDWLVCALLKIKVMWMINHKFEFPYLLYVLLKKLFLHLFANFNLFFSPMISYVWDNREHGQIKWARINWSITHDKSMRKAWNYQFIYYLMIIGAKENYIRPL